MRIRWLVLASLALAVHPPAAECQGLKPKPALVVVQAPGGGGSVSITFVQVATGAPITALGANQATLDLGRLTYFGGSSDTRVRTTRLPGALQVSTDFGIQVDKQGNTSKTASVSAFLLSNPAAFPVTIDGVPLGSAAQVITPNASFGLIVSHALSLQVPTSLPAGPLTLAVGVLATVN